MRIRSLARLDSLLEAIDGRSTDSSERLEETCAVIMRVTITFDNGNPRSMLRVLYTAYSHRIPDLKILFRHSLATNSKQFESIEQLESKEINSLFFMFNMFLYSLMCSDAFLPVPMDNPTGCHVISPTDSSSLLTNEFV